MYPLVQNKNIVQPRPQLFLWEWQSIHNGKQTSDEEILGMNIATNAIKSCTDIPSCMIVQN